MKKFYLCLSTDTTSNVDKVFLKEKVPFDIQFSPFSNKFSPIYCINPDKDYTNLISEFSGSVLFLFTLDTYYCIGRLLNQTNVARETEGIFISHGIASIIIFLKNENTFKSVLNAISSNIAGYEKWEIENNIILSSKIELKNGKDSGEIDFYCHLLEPHDRNAAIEIIASLRYGYYLSSIYAKSYDKFFKSSQNSTEEIVINILYLQDKISIDTLKTALQSLHSEDEVYDENEYIEYLEKSKSESRKRLIFESQLRDELVQISAILKSINSQAFCGIAPIRNTGYRTGNYSLLGIGLAYSSIVAVYDYVWNIFNEYQIPLTIKYEFLKLPSPAFWTNPAEYEKWCSEIKGFQGANVARKYRTRRKYHLLYFSNRLGFRETKQSITSAYQAINFGILPSWSFSTLFHEYLHAINRAIISNSYPYSDENCFKQTYDNYIKMSKYAFTPKNLLQFIRTIFILSSICLECHSKTGKSGKVSISSNISSDVVLNIVKKWHHDIDEIMVHIFDFNYFFGNKVELYVKSIWSSWIELPFTISRSKEYLFRTICAVSCSVNRDREYRFDWSVNKIISELRSLKTINISNSQKIDEIIKTLETGEILNELKIKFTEICSLIDSTVQFLICPQIKEELVRDPESYGKAEESHTYFFNVGSFEELRIASPIRFIIEMKERFFNGEIELNNNNVSFLSLWFMSLITSSMLRKEENHE